MKRLMIKTLVAAAALAAFGLASAQEVREHTIKSVSYTHLTLPTIYSV